MRIKLITALLMLSISTAFAQQTIVQKAIPITKAEFDKHLAVIDLIAKPFTKLKSHGVLKLKTTKKTFVWKDDGEFFEYKHEGDLKGYPIAVIHEIESNTERHYLVNKVTGTIDTLLDRPIFYSDRKSAICLEGSWTDVWQRIQVGELRNNRFITKTFIKLARQPFIAPDYIYWYDKHTIFIADNKTKFYKIELKN